MARLGLFALPFPAEIGGAGGDFIAYCLAMEEIARADASCAITLEAAVSLGISPIARFGSREQQQRWLPSLMAGERLGIRPHRARCGSDAAGTQTRAVRDGDDWVINGRKAFITNAGTDISAGVTITAITGSQNGHKEISTIAVERGLPGTRRLPSIASSDGTRPTPVN